jgi:hypothetical protein
MIEDNRVRQIARRDARLRVIAERKEGKYFWPAGMREILNSYFDAVAQFKKILDKPNSTNLATIEDAAINLFEELKGLSNMTKLKRDRLIEERESKRIELEEATEASEELKIELAESGKMITTTSSAPKNQVKVKRVVLVIITLAIIIAEGLMALGFFTGYGFVSTPMENLMRAGSYLLIAVIYLIIVNVTDPRGTKSFSKFSEIIIIIQVLFTISAGIAGSLPGVSDEWWYAALVTNVPLLLLAVYIIFLFSFLRIYQIKRKEGFKDTKEIAQNILEDIDPDIATANGLVLKINTLNSEISKIENEISKLESDVLPEAYQLELEQVTRLNEVQVLMNTIKDAQASKDNLLNQIDYKLDLYKSYYMSQFKKTPDSLFAAPKWPNREDVKLFFNL